MWNLHILVIDIEVIRPYESPRDTKVKNSIMEKKCNFYPQLIKMERFIYMLSVVKLKSLKEYIRESSIFIKFFLRVLFKMEYENVVEIKAEYEAQKKN